MTTTNTFPRLGLRARFQNLHERPGDGGAATGNIFRHGRVWIDPIDDAYEAPRARFEWVLGEMGLSLRLAVDDSDGPAIDWHVCLPGAQVYGSFGTSQALVDAVRRRAGVKPYAGVNIFLARFHASTLHWEAMHSTHDWSSNTPTIRYGDVELRSLMGELKIETRLLGSAKHVVIPMPEGSYDWTIQRKVTTHRRGQWHRKRYFGYVCKAKVSQQIPHPGKGENSWDCGSDALFEAYVPDNALRGHRSTVHDVVAHIVGSQLVRRAKRGAAYDYSDGGAHDPKRKPS